MIQVRDPLDSFNTDPNAHGTGFDRVGAFQDGFIGGVSRCKPFFTEDRQLIQLFVDRFNPSGNLPFDDGTDNDIQTLIPADLDRFWAKQMETIGTAFTTPTLQVFAESGPFPACDGATESDFTKNRVFYCASTNQIMVDQDLAERLTSNEFLGDMSVGYLIGEAYSEAVQDTLNSSLEDKARVLVNDCLTGAWVADDVPVGVNQGARGGGTLTLSAGDLDEAILTALERSDASTDTDKRGTAFEKIASFRNGVLNGFDACRQELS